MPTYKAPVDDVQALPPSLSSQVASGTVRLLDR